MGLFARKEGPKREPSRIMDLGQAFVDLFPHVGWTTLPGISTKSDPIFKKWYNTLIFLFKFTLLFGFEICFEVVRRLQLQGELPIETR